MKRAVRAVIRAGQSVRGVRFERDKFTIITGPTEDTSANMTNETTNEWDEKYGEH